MRTEKQWREWLLKRAKAFYPREVDREDLVQEVILAFWQRHDLILPWNYPDEEEAKRHCLRLLKDRYIEHSRRLSSQREVLESELEVEWESVMIQMEQDVVEHAHCMELIARLEQMLSPRQQQILVLLAQGLTYAEIAVALGIEEGSVKSQINRIRSKARTLLKGM